MKILTINHTRIALPDSANIDRLIETLKTGKLVEFSYEGRVWVTPPPMSRNRLEFSVEYTDKIHPLEDLPKLIKAKEDDAKRVEENAREFERTQLAKKSAKKPGVSAS